VSRNPIFEVRDLKVHFEAARGLFSKKRDVRAVDGISFDVIRGNTLALVGESGSGKTTTARAMVRLVRPTSGSISFEGKSVASFSGERLKNYRKRVQYIFQDPYESLNPRQTIFNSIATPIRIHKLATSNVELSTEVDRFLRSVELDPVLTRNKYPYQLSGGQRQRVNIARALASRPDVIIADEPVSMLDVSLRMGILKLLDHLRKTLDLTFLIITHDIAVARQVSDVMAVMYLGKIVEIGTTEAVVERPIHPYTKLLIDATPKLVLSKSELKKREQNEITPKGGESLMGSALNLPSGCRFHPRCPYAIEKCKLAEPPLLERRTAQFAACDVVDVD
jgi:peptide/nickel transport system ATP-binding protein